MPGTIQAKDKRIKDIINAAFREFIRWGYDGVSMEKIAKRAKIDRSTLYHYFSNKESVLAAVRERLFEPVQVMMNSAGGLDAVTGLRKFIEDYLKYWASHPREQEFYLLGVVHTLQNKVWWPHVNVRIAAMINWYEYMLSCGVKQGQLVKHDTAAQATALFCAVEGAVPYVTTCTKTLSVKRVVKGIMKGIVEEKRKAEI
ncbi:TetR/AcrR family transcriptional regulator [candidate division KSB1 bacterium]|nr:MAG: TetR/AcrR family transcriptional regulator [candidate division KSB1 bacterium]